MSAGSATSPVQRGTELFGHPVRSREQRTEHPHIAAGDPPRCLPESGKQLERLLALLGPLGAHTSLDFGTLTGTEPVRSEAEREDLRREVEAIAKASGLEP